MTTEFRLTAWESWNDAKNRLAAQNPSNQGRRVNIDVLGGFFFLLLKRMHKLICFAFTFAYN